jgi:hypothetical protein
MSMPALSHNQVETRIAHAGGTRGVMEACMPEAMANERDVTRFAMLLPTLDRGIAYAARYVSGQSLCRYRIVHEPRSFLRRLGEFLIRWPAANRVFWWLAFVTRGRRYIDPIADYTFFMDGNVRAHELGRRLGLGMRVVQQSFLVPVAATMEFIDRARHEFRRRACSCRLPSSGRCAHGLLECAGRRSRHARRGRAYRE